MLTRKPQWQVIKWVFRGSLWTAALAMGVLLLAQAGDWLDVSGPPAQADFAFVVPGEENTRPFVAALLYREGFVRKILVAENELGSAQQEGLLPTTGQIIAQVLQRRGVASEDVIPIGGATTNTWDDLGRLSTFLAKHPGQSVIVITSSFHTRRCAWILRRQLGRGAKRVHFVAAPIEWYDGIPWWTRREVATTVASEYLKFAYYWGRYGDGYLWLAAGGGVLVLVWIGRRWWRTSVRARCNDETRTQD